jgi:hypothetical protein
MGFLAELQALGLAQYYDRFVAHNVTTIEGVWGCGADDLRGMGFKTPQIDEITSRRHKKRADLEKPFGAERVTTGMSSASDS